LRRSRWSKLRRAYVDLVRERYEIVFSMAVECARRGDYERARALASYILDMVKATRVRLPRSMKRSICKNCHLPLIPGVTSTIRFRSQSRRFAYKVVKCKACGFIHRYPYKRGSVSVSRGEG